MKGSVVVDTTCSHCPQGIHLKSWEREAMAFAVKLAREGFGLEGGLWLFEQKLARTRYQGIQAKGLRVGG